MDPRDQSRRVDLQEQTSSATAWPRIKIVIIAAFLGLAVGVALFTVLDGAGGTSDSDASFAAWFLGLAVAWAFNVVGSHLVKIWALLSDHAANAPQQRRAEL